MEGKGGKWRRHSERAGRNILLSCRTRRNPANPGQEAADPRFDNFYVSVFDVSLFLGKFHSVYKRYKR